MAKVVYLSPLILEWAQKSMAHHGYAAQSDFGRYVEWLIRQDHQSLSGEQPQGLDLLAAALATRRGGTADQAREDILRELAEILRLARGGGGSTPTTPPIEPTGAG